MPSLPSLKENTMPVLFFQLHLEYKDFSPRKHNARFLHRVWNTKICDSRISCLCHQLYVDIGEGAVQGCRIGVLAPEAHTSFLPKYNEILDLQIH